MEKATQLVLEEHYLVANNLQVPHQSEHKLSFVFSIGVGAVDLLCHEICVVYTEACPVEDEEL